MTTAANGTPYSKLLRDPRWQRKRLEILHRDNWTCAACLRGDKPLHVHHVVYGKRPPWDYPDHLYQTLCEDCHRERQAIVDNTVNAFRIALKNIPTARLEKLSKFLFERAMEELG